MSSTDYGYLQHGMVGTPMRTERVRIKPEEGKPGDCWLAFYEGRWRKVHVQVNGLYIVYRGHRITIKIEGV
jgi:hypothetical protein